MASRDSSYDLDGIFATRMQGQLVQAVPNTGPRMIRTPGLQQLHGKPNVALKARGTARAVGLGEETGTITAPINATIKLPVIGEVSRQTALIGGAIAAVGLILLLRR